MKLKPIWDYKHSQIEGGPSLNYFHSTPPLAYMIKRTAHYRNTENTPQLNSGAASSMNLEWVQNRNSYGSLCHRSGGR